MAASRISRSASQANEARLKKLKRNGLLRRIVRQRRPTTWEAPVPPRLAERIASRERRQLFGGLAPGSLPSASSTPPPGSHPLLFRPRSMPAPHHLAPSPCP